MTNKEKGINFFDQMGLKNYTPRHLKIVTDFLESGETDVKPMLGDLGIWDIQDLIKAKKWFNG